MQGTDLDLLVAAARGAGDIALGYSGPNTKSWDKDDNAGPVTEADLAVDAYLRETLLAARPEYGWLSEETEDDVARLERECVFIVDPIDGTRSFMAGERTWAHSIAIAQNGQVVAGVVFLPMLDRLYAAAKDEGATVNDDPIACSERAELFDARILTTKASLAPHHWNGRAPEVQFRFRPSLAYRMALVAEGRYDGMLTFRDTWEWDIAAGTLIAKEAGAIATDQDGGILRYNQRHPQFNGIVCAGASIHQQIIAR